MKRFIELKRFCGDFVSLRASEIVAVTNSASNQDTCLVCVAGPMYQGSAQWYEIEMSREQCVAAIEQFEDENHD